MTQNDAAGPSASKEPPAPTDTAMDITPKTAATPSDGAASDHAPASPPKAATGAPLAPTKTAMDVTPEKEG
jgi:hypothetical protein